MLEVYREITRLIECGRRGALATIIGTQGSTPGKESAKMLVRDDGSTVGTVGGGCTEAEIRQLALESLASDRPMRRSFRITAATAAQTGLLCGGEFEVYIDPVGNPSVFVFGAGHIAQRLVPILSLLEYRTVVVDDRDTFASRELFPDATEVHVKPMDACVDPFPIGADAFVVVVTRDHQHDEAVLAQALQTEARYVGVIGSRGKVGAIRKHLRDQGIARSDVERVRGPIGVSIGSRTPEEIAVSIAAELIAVRRGVDSSARDE